jgi:8-oxo-dGTP pyrophosphatase MutT (NUDIX family)
MSSPILQTPAMRWPAIAVARRTVQPRIDFHVDDCRVGSVAMAHLPALQRWPQWLVQDERGLHLTVPAPGRDEALADINTALRAEGLIVAWRDETFPLYAPDAGTVLARFERAAARFWGALTRGAHANGYVADADGRPTHLWIARRSDRKATDPGLFDNLVGGGVPHGQTPLETLMREGFEEAGLTPAQMAGARRGRVIHIDRDVPEGRMVEHVHAFDVQLPAVVQPQNQDGEVASIALLPVAEAAALAAGDTMTVAAALVTLDFLLRHRLLPAEQQADLSARMAALCLP